MRKKANFLRKKANFSRKNAQECARKKISQKLLQISMQWLDLSFFQYWSNILAYIIGEIVNAYWQPQSNSFLIWGIPFYDDHFWWVTAIPDCFFVGMTLQVSTFKAGDQQYGWSFKRIL